MIAMSTAKQNVEASVPAQGERGSPIDRVHLARMTLGERRLECEVLALFVRQAGMLLQRMGRAEPKAVAAAAHTLKVTCAPSCRKKRPPGGQAELRIVA
jgi:hypothetical protein